MLDIELQEVGAKRSLNVQTHEHFDLYKALAQRADALKTDALQVLVTTS